MSYTIKRALISVSDKTGIVEFSKKLHTHGIEILSTSGTAQLLKKHNIPVTDVKDVTGFPEIMDGRVKTLHPKIHGGILARGAEDLDTLKQHNITPIDLIVVNLYPFQNTIAKTNCPHEEAIENIDIGGPAMLRAAAKNYQHVMVVVDPSDYEQVLRQLEQDTISESFRFDLAAKAFSHTASYDANIANYFAQANETITSFPDSFYLNLEKISDLRYGENPHQKASLYRESQLTQNSIISAQQLQGKMLSFNNIVDADTALQCVKEFNVPACVIVKHANPCGVGLGIDATEAYLKAYNADPTSAFGGVIAFNCAVDPATTAGILARQFVEVIVAPEFTSAALSLFKAKENLRLLEIGELDAPRIKTKTLLDYKRIEGGLLIQTLDQITENFSDFDVVTKRNPRLDEQRDLTFVWKICQYVKSNAIVYGRHGQTLGIGTGQTSRIFSAHIAGLKAKEFGFDLKKAAMASDAFFPFRDSIDEAHKAGIECIIQPGGSIRDKEVIDAADEHNMVMVFTHRRHFRH